MFRSNKVLAENGLNRIIIEATNHCNLDCSMCLRRSWGSELGMMSQVVFSKLLAEIATLPNPPGILFGGYGEPLSHPRILEMIDQLNTLNCRITLISNGTLLTPELVSSLVQAGLQKLWISVDISHQEAFHFSQGNGAKKTLLDIITGIQQNGNGDLRKLDPGLAFVLTKTNQTKILQQLEKGLELGLRSFFITNLEAYSDAQSGLLPYNLSQLRQPGSWQNGYAELTQSLDQLKSIYPELQIEGVISQQSRICPFAERGDLVLRWDGTISPCLPLLYGRRTYIGSWEHIQLPFSPGDLINHTLLELWADPDFAQLRNHLLNEDFSPCLACRDCWLSDDNQQDCMGFTHPTCGGCLWAAGLVNCP